MEGVLTWFPLWTAGFAVGSKPVEAARPHCSDVLPIGTPNNRLLRATGRRVGVVNGAAERD
jgi:hypothetical protein